MIIIQDIIPYYKYAFVFDFDPVVLDFCKKLKEEHTWKHFNFVDGRWRFSSLDIGVQIQEKFPAVQISEEVSIDFGLAKFSIEESRIRAAQAERIKQAKDSDISVEGLKEELYPYQAVGVEFFVNSLGRAILADQMGTGKTAQSLAYVVHSRQKKTLVVCPASVKHSWEKEIQKWTSLRYKILNSQSDPEIFGDDRFDIFIVNYDIIIKFFEQIISAGFTCLIGDECHYIKNGSAIRTKVFRRIASSIPSVILLSGTPMLSRPVELFNSLNIIDPKTWDSYYDYTVRYCQGHRGKWGWDARGASNLDELQDRIGKYFLRRTKQEALPGLPEKVFVFRPVELEKKVQKEYDLAVNEFGKFLREVKKKKTPEIMRSLQAEKLTKLGELRQLTTKGKVKAAEEIIENAIENHEKILVFSCYNEPLEILSEKFKDRSVILTGATAEEDRKEYIERFQNNPDTMVFFGGTRSAGVGITLTAATNVLFIDYSWTPADHSQAIDRLHRPGQKASQVNIYHLYAIDTIDEYMTKILERKQLLFDKVIEGATGNVKAGNLMNDVLRMIERKSENIKETDEDVLSEVEDLGLLDSEQEDNSRSVEAAVRGQLL